MTGEHCSSWMLPMSERDQTSDWRKQSTACILLLCEPSPGSWGFSWAFPWIVVNGSCWHLKPRDRLQVLFSSVGHYTESTGCGQIPARTFATIWNECSLWCRRCCYHLDTQVGIRVNPSKSPHTGSVLAWRCHESAIWHFYASPEAGVQTYPMLASPRHCGNEVRGELCWPKLMKIAPSYPGPSF